MSSKIFKQFLGDKGTLAEVVRFGYFLAVLSLSTALAWPIHEHLNLILASAAGAVGGFTAAHALPRLAKNLWLKIFWLTGFYFATLFATLFLGQKFSLRDTPYFLSFGLEILASPITVWKSLLTLESPVGNYGMVLTAPFTVYFVTGFFWFRKKSKRNHNFTLLENVVRDAVVFLPAVYAVIFTPQRVNIQTQMALLFALFLLGFWFHRSGMEAPPLSIFKPVIVLIGAAVLVVSSSQTIISDGSSRVPLRTKIEHSMQLRSATNELVNYRKYFSQNLHDQELFKVLESGNVTRLTLATYGGFDGQQVTPLPETQKKSTYRRFTNDLVERKNDDTTSIRITKLFSEHLPLPGNLNALKFSGDNAFAAKHSFYYSSETNSGALLNEPLSLKPPLAYDVSSHAGQPAGDLSSLIKSPLSAKETDTKILEIETWLQKEGFSHDGHGLQKAFEQLRNSGYLSHGLLEDAAAETWARDFEDYVFMPSRSGHSLNRIRSLFNSLTEYDGDGRFIVSQGAAETVVGDDEQFSVAAALIAKHMGFTARVAVGFRLEASDSNLTVCEEGVCKGQHAAAWVEVFNHSTGEWIPADVSPQRTRNPETVNIKTEEAKVNHRVPTPHPDLGREENDVQASGDAEALPGGTEKDTERVRQSFTDSKTFIVVALLTVCVAVVVTVFWRKRRSRRIQQMAGRRRVEDSWKELEKVFAALFKEEKQNRTRVESATLFTLTRRLKPYALETAVTADRIIFSFYPPAEDDVKNAVGVIKKHRKTLMRQANLTEKLMILRLRKGWNRRWFKRASKK